MQLKNTKYDLIVLYYVLIREVLLLCKCMWMQETRSARKLKSVNSDLTILFLLWVKKRKKKYINNFLTISIVFFLFHALFRC